MKLTKQQIQQDLDNLPQPYKTADVDRLIRQYVRQKADVSELRAYILTQQQCPNGNIGLHTAGHNPKQTKSKYAGMTGGHHLNGYIKAQ